MKKKTVKRVIKKNFVIRIEHIIFFLGLGIVIGLIVFLSSSLSSSQTTNAKAEALIEPVEEPLERHTQLITYNGTSAIELQNLINRYPTHNLKVVLKKDIRSGSGKTCSVKTPQREGFASRYVSSKCMLYLDKGRMSNRTISIESTNRITVQLGVSYGIYAKEITLNVKNIILKGAVASSNLPSGQEPGYIWADNSTLNLENITIDGKNDRVGNASILDLQGNVVGQLKRGVAGIYSLDSKVNIKNAEILTTSWDSITLNGSTKATIKGGLIKDYHPEVNGGAGIALTHTDENVQASAVVDGVKIENKVKGIITFGSTELIIKNSDITSEPMNGSYAISHLSFGHFELINTKVVGMLGQVLYAPWVADGSIIENNTLIYHRDPNLTREQANRLDGAAIELSPDLIEVLPPAFRNNIIRYTRGINIAYVITDDPRLLEKIKEAGNTFELLD